VQAVSVARLMAASMALASSGAVIAAGCGSSGIGQDGSPFPVVGEVGAVEFPCTSAADCEPGPGLLRR
jgi:hypothetical protein